jgi:hypothetical protein
MITQERLKQLLEYNPSTGEFVRLVDRSHNARAGSIAGTLSRGSPRDGGGYLQTHIDGKVYLNHRLAFLYMTGEIPAVVDHINHVRHDNRWCNLRALPDHVGNDKNVSLKPNNKSGISGVYWDKRRRSWAAEIVVSRKKHFLGRFALLEDAAVARKNAESAFGFHENHGKPTSVVMSLRIERREMEAAE